MRTHQFWTAAAIAAASIVLGIGFTAMLGAGEAISRLDPTAGAWRPAMMGRFPSAPPSCSPPALPGAAVDVTLTDMGGGMMARGMMAPNVGGQDGYRWPHIPMMGMPGMQRISLSTSTVATGPVSLRVLNAGFVGHELVVLPLAQGQFSGQRPVGPNGKVDEAGSLGEASRTCGPDEGDEQSGNPGIAPGTTGWTTINLPPGRYELVCNIAGHYAAGMYAELDVIS
ncbi:MAG: sulfocyanin-like copper-binding protein [Mycobacterium sp.]